MLLVGDTAQLGAVEAGDAFPMLVNDRPDAPVLTQVHRFHQPWERDASVPLRVGQHTAIYAYAAHGRVHGGDRADMLDDLYEAWRHDSVNGLASLMRVEDRDSMNQLN